jgi:hypothetical protein
VWATKAKGVGMTILDPRSLSPPGAGQSIQGLGRYGLLVVHGVQPPGPRRRLPLHGRYGRRTLRGSMTVRSRGVRAGRAMDE